MKMEGDCKMREECVISESTKGFDPGFKLFGKTIPVGCCAANGTVIKRGEKPSPEAESESKQESPVVAESCSRESIKDSGSEANPEGEEEVRSSIEAENNEGKNGHKPALKKPDKLLPCPRCESMDTKFCYYNNYNVNQPRHFCKNCQRYWTAGGTLRNVPVGAGRRKNKHSAAASPASSTQYRQIRSASDVAAIGIQAEDSEGVLIPCSLPKVGALGGSRVQVLPLEVMDSGAPKVGGCSASGSTVLNFGPQRIANRGPGGADCEQMEWQHQQQSRDEISCGSSVTAEREIQCNMHAAPADGHNPKWPNGTVPVSGAGAAAPFLAGPWPFGWNFAAPGPWGAAVPWPMVAGSHLGAWPPAPWITAPWAVPVPVPAATPCNNSCDSAVPDSGSPTLGKRHQSEPEGKQSNGCLWVPKTLRIDDPGEAAKSSFWTTLGLGDKPDSSLSGRVMFKAFRPKTEGTKDYSPLKPEPAAEALRANPAAFSRSISFQESN